MRIAVSLVLLSSWALAAQQEVTYHGTADVSAVVFLDKQHFVAADDETNTLRIYRISDTNKPFSKLNLDFFLMADPDHPEADLEAAARVGNTIYWISSHGRNKDGKLRPSRYRFFATEIQHLKTDKNEGVPSLTPVGLPCSTLIDQFLKEPAAREFNLQAFVQKDQDLSKKERKKLAPKEQGLNIESMAWLPESGSLLIGLRNPLWERSQEGTKYALLFELLNPQEVIAAKAARFGRTLLWDLGNRGLRAMEYDSFQRRFYVIAGAVDSETTSVLYLWDGNLDHAPEPVFEWPETGKPFTPEALAMDPDGQTLWIFSDDGSLEIPVQSPSECEEDEWLDSGLCPNKHLTDDLQKTFRAQIFDVNNDL